MILVKIKKNNQMFGNIYKSPYYKQKGFGIYGVKPYMQAYGFGDVIKKFLYPLIPMLKSSSKVIGKQALQSGVKILENMGNKNNSKSLNEIIRDEKKNAIENLRQKTIKKINSLKASGIKKRKTSLKASTSKILENQLKSLTGSGKKRDKQAKKRKATRQKKTKRMRKKKRSQS